MCYTFAFIKKLEVVLNLFKQEVEENKVAGEKFIPALSVFMS